MPSKKTSVCLTVILVAAFHATSSQSFAVTTPPTITPTSRLATIGGSLDVFMTAPAGSIFLTTDGSVPTAASTPLTGDFFPQANTQVNAIAINAGVASTVASNFYYFSDTGTQIAPPQVWYFDTFGPKAPTLVPIWGDMSASNNNATQTTAAKQPTLVHASANNQGSLLFNGTSSDMQVPSLTFSSSGLSIFIVANATVPTANAQILNFSGATAPQNLIGFGESSTKTPQFTIYNSAGSSSTNVASATVLPTNQFQLLEAVQGDINATTCTLFVNGSQVAQNTAMNPVPAASLTNNFVGQSSSGSSFFKGNIAEVIVYTSPLTVTQRTLVEAYLMQRYQIFSQVPTAPIFSNPTSTLTAPVMVAISAQPSATVHFTTDGTTPSASSPVYKSAVPISYTQTLKAVAIQNGLSSSVITATYTLSAQYPAPAAGGPALQVNLTAPVTSIP